MTRIEVRHDRQPGPVEVPVTLSPDEVVVVRPGATPPPGVCPSIEAEIPGMKIELRRAARCGERVAFLCVDCDATKRAEASSAATRRVFQHVAECVARAAEGGTHQLCRRGDGGFLLRLHGLRHPDDALRTAGEIVQRVGEPLHLQGHAFEIAASVGIAIFPDDASELDALLAAAEGALEAALLAGGGSYQRAGEPPH